MKFKVQWHEVNRGGRAPGTVLRAYNPSHVMYVQRISDQRCLVQLTEGASVEIHASPDEVARYFFERGGE